MLSEDLQVLQDAIARNTPAALSLPSAGLARCHRTRCIRGEEGGFWVEVGLEEKPLIDELIREGRGVGLAFKLAESKMIFVAKPIEFRSEMELNQETMVAALLLEWPAEIKRIQRRDAYRVSVPAGARLPVQIWRIAEKVCVRERPAASARLNITVRDISAGGMRIEVALRDDDPKLVASQRLRISLMHSEKEHIVEGWARHIEPISSGGLQVGVQFGSLSSDIDGRRTLAALTHIIGLLEREEAKRRKYSRLA